MSAICKALLLWICQGVTQEWSEWSGTVWFKRSVPNTTVKMTRLCLNLQIGRPTAPDIVWYGGKGVELLQHEVTELLQHRVTGLLQHGVTGLLQHGVTGLLQHGMTGLLQHRLTGRLQHGLTGLLQHGVTVTVTTWSDNDCYNMDSLGCYNME